MTFQPPSADAQTDAFAQLKPRLVPIWNSLQADPSFEHTSVIVPSLSVDQDELAKIMGASFYEERLMFALIRLRNPNARVIYVTSQPVHEDIVDYYLDLLSGVPTNHARKRLHMVTVCDASAIPLTQKLLDRPRVLARLRAAIGQPERAYLTCYNSTVLERQLAVELGIPLNGVDPNLLANGTKSGSRKIFAEAGVSHPLGFEDLHGEDEIVAALVKLAQQRPGVRRAVVKINEGFSGEGNGVFVYPEQATDPAAIAAALPALAWSSQQKYTVFLSKFAAMGGIVEEMIDAEEVRSPSVQMRICPNGQGTLVSSHEQLLGGATGQVYLGCRFPANDDYRVSLQREAIKVADALSRRGVIGRFGVDFLASRTAQGTWQHHAIEINLRMGGTTPPFHALEFLTGGRLDTQTGLFATSNATCKFYSATDNLKSPDYRGLMPEDLFEIVSQYKLHYDHASGTGVLFYMIGALSQYGKVGMTCIGNSAAEAEALFQRTVDALDERTGDDGHHAHGAVQPLLDRFTTME